ncbi:hypothetical protein HDU76_002016 [Blyttiomyces sp. JEL0837]|nr:hypothetical protein HDU76_002016 [Blyttiomyces sp. JEL0837]
MQFGGVQCSCSDDLSQVSLVDDRVCQACDWNDGGLCGIQYQQKFFIGMVNPPKVTLPAPTTENPVVSTTQDVPAPVTSNTPDNPPPPQTTDAGTGDTGSNNNGGGQQNNGGDQQNPTQPIDIPIISISTEISTDPAGNIITNAITSTLISQSIPSSGANNNHGQKQPAQAPAQTTSPSSPNGKQNDSGSTGTGSSSPQTPIAGIAGGIVGAVVLLVVGSVIVWKRGNAKTSGRSSDVDNSVAGVPAPYAVTVVSSDGNSSHNAPVNSVNRASDMSMLSAGSSMRRNADNPFYGNNASLGRSGTFRAAGFDTDGYNGNEHVEPVV